MSEYLHRQQRPRYGIRHGIALGLALALVVASVLWVVLPKTHPAVTTLRTAAVPTTTAPATSSTTVQPGPPETITVNGTTAPNPLMQANAPGVDYAPPNYTGAPQAGVGPMHQLDFVPGYGPLMGCDLYVGSQKIGEQYPAKILSGPDTGKTYQCDPSETPASIPQSKP